MADGPKVSHQHGCEAPNKFFCVEDSAVIDGNFTIFYEKQKYAKHNLFSAKQSPATVRLDFAHSSPRASLRLLHIPGFIHGKPPVKSWISRSNGCFERRTRRTKIRLAARLSPIPFPENNSWPAEGVLDSQKPNHSI